MEFETEEQQAEAVKKWFKEYGPTIVLGLVIGLGGVFGYGYYNEHQEQQMQMASEAYESVVEHISGEEKNLELFNAEMANFRAQHGVTAYSNLLDMYAAKTAIESKDLAAAETALNRALNEAQHVSLEHTARLRLARVLIAQEKYDEALQLIADQKEASYRYSYELLRGDIWFAKGDKARAKKAYDEAKALAIDAPPHPDLDMLLTELNSVDMADEAVPGASND